MTICVFVNSTERRERNKDICMERMEDEKEKRKEEKRGSTRR